MKAIKQMMVGLILTVPLMGSALAVTITIGKGSGIVWEGLPYNERFLDLWYLQHLIPFMGCWLSLMIL
jgi:hypothetical protein